MSGIPDFTTVVGVDESHLRQLACSWPTWKRFKPSLLERPMLIFCDWRQLKLEDVLAVVDHPKLQIVAWPPCENIEYEGTPGDKWSDPQRYRMLAGFVHVPAILVQTRYWLKIDTDVIATGNDDWIKPEWFNGWPAIVSHPWSFSRPADQMLKLDRWAEAHNVVQHFNTPPLDLIPKEGSERVGHKRIISFVGFFSTQFSRWCANWAGLTAGPLKLPVCSQDSFHWYMAKRRPYGIVRANMKGPSGWEQHCTSHVVERRAKEVLSGS